MSSRRALSALSAVLGGMAAVGAASPAAGSGRAPFFVRNVGQLPADVLFLASAPGGRVLVRADGVVFRFEEREAAPTPRGVSDRRAAAAPGRFQRAADVRCRFPGAAIQVVPEEPLPRRLNLLVGNRPERWFTGIPAYGRVRLKGVARGADLVLDPSGGALDSWYLVFGDGRSDGTVVPVLDASCPVQLEAGRALIATPFGSREIRYPSAARRSPGAAGRTGGGAVAGRGAGLAVAAPEQLLWGTYLSSGGEGRSVGGSALDAAGNLYLVGSRQGSDGSLGTFVTMLTAAGPARPWDIELGSALTEVGNAVAVDRDGSVIVVGYTDDPALPALGGYDPTINGSLDAFVARLSPGLDVVWMTYLGGSSADFAHAVAIGPGGEVIVAGDTQSVDFPVPSGHDVSFGGEVDGFVAALSADGTRLSWATYLGGAKWEHLAALALSPDGGTVAVGATTSADFPTPGGLFRTNRGGTDMFAASLTPVGELRWGTLLGGADSDLAEAVAVDPSGDVFLCGGTASADAPIVGGIQSALGGRPYDGYVARLRAAGDALVWATYLGGADSDTCSALRLDAAGNVVIGGMTWSDGMPAPQGYSTTLAGPADAYVATLAATGSELLWATYLGGSERDAALALETLPNGRVLVAGDTRSADLPATPGLDPTFSGSDDAFAVALQPPAPGAGPAADFTWSPLAPVVGAPVRFTDTSRGSPLSWSWTFGDGGTSTQPNPTHAFAACGATTVSLAIGSPAGSSTVSRRLTVTPCSALGYSVWVPVASHAPGLHGSQWRTDLGILNPGGATVNLELRHLVGTGVGIGTTYVPAGTQSILVDVVAQIGSSGTGPVQVRSDRPVIVTSRTYNVMSSESLCLPGGTQGQSYSALGDGEGLAAGQAALLPQLSEDARYRTNVMLVNVGAAPATATVTLYDGAGTQLGTPYAVTLQPGERKQQDRVFHARAGQTNMTRGYARVEATGGSGVVAYASVVDNITNDPTTVLMVREAASTSRAAPRQE